MADLKNSAEARALSEKLNQFILTHQQIIGDFGRSLANSAHFIVLANRSVEKEPLETVTMLEQIKEIDLLGNLSNQLDEFRGVAGLLMPHNTPLDDLALQGEVAELETKYEGLLEEAEKQMQQIEALLATFQVQH